VPEGVEIELYRRAADSAVGRTIVDVRAPDPWFLKRGLTAPVAMSALVGHQVTGARRHGKLLLLDTDGGPVIGLRFGMTGRLVVDDAQAIEHLEYGSGRDLPQWDRFALGFGAAGTLRLNDPRRLGGVELDPDETALGPDASTVTVRQLTRVLAASDVAVKARLMDQERLAGLGNLLTDEILWRAGIDPARPARSITVAEVRRLQRHIRVVFAELLAAGGSHLGRLQTARQRGGRCPLDGAELERRTIGGRTTYSCPRHQE
jgi:formamidopyrimidine-DNA glycosylase